MNGRVVFDTNALVSAALLKGSASRRAFDRARAMAVVLASQATVSELNEVLARPKFHRYLTTAERLEFIAAYLRETEIVDVPDAIRACRDPDDDKFLDLAVAGNAGCIISGDRDLQSVSPFLGITVISPADFLAQTSGAS